ncbi:hypothetical protein OSB04_017436 [Centaurea solstitialis]|uniref:V-SNARE coiled-coil homology domain-containing protein n=1 Tax=Centaurea solstitialis TaxID=347529 RepID=A0AA38TDV1_9ASTR|nr:hypothetical protein OSB04_017436 [Centaurea solstitialis]
MCMLLSQEDPKLKDFEPHIVVHYGIPSTASILAFDPLQHLLAIGTQDGRIKVIGGDNIECLLISPTPVPLKNLEFLENQGFLVSVSNENVVQVWDLEQRRLASSLRWESNISAFSVVCGTNYMYVGDEYGYMSVLKYDIEEGNIQLMPYQIPPDLIADEAGIQIPDQQSVVGLVAQPCTSGKRHGLESGIGPGYVFSQRGEAVLIAYQNGVIILWDVSEDKAVLIRAYKDLQLKDEIVIRSTSDVKRQSLNHASDDEQAEKEISALCWVSSDGSMLAVGYVDGDIVLWNLSTAIATKDQKANKSYNNATKLRFSSGDKRLPVIVLHWSANNAYNGNGGQLFVYGGDDIGSEEVLTVSFKAMALVIFSVNCILNLDLSSGIEALKCIKRSDLTLNGPYGDIALVPGAAENSYATLFVLTNPGQLHVYDDDCLSKLISAPEKHAVNAVQYPVTLPTAEPNMTVTKLCSVEGTEVPGASAPISALDFNSTMSSLAVGTDCGLVHLLELVGESEEKNVPLVTESKREEIDLHHGNGWQSTAVFSYLNSPVRSLQYISSGSRIVVGHECGKAAVLDVQSSSVLFITDSLVSSSSPVVSMAMKTYLQTDTDDPEKSGNTSPSDPPKEVAFVLTKDAQIILVDSSSGDKICSRSVNPKESTAISLYLLGKPATRPVTDEKFPVPELSVQDTANSSQDSTDGKESSSPTNAEPESDSAEAKVNLSSEGIELWKNFVDSLILVCCEDSMLLYSTKSLIQGEPDIICKVDLEKQCCWTTIFKKDEVESGVVLVYSAGVVEIRSLPDLKVLAETSITSILRWNFMTNMEKTMSSSGNGHITMVYGCELAIISLFTSENDFRIPEALPRLHDKVVAEAAEAALKFSLSQKSKQAPRTGLIGGIIKGIKREKENENANIEETRDVLVPKLEALFSRTPFSVSDLDFGDDLDEPIKSNEPMPIKLVVERIEVEGNSPTRSPQTQSQPETNKQTERDRLLEGGTEPKARTAEEVKAKYRKSATGDTAAMAQEAKDKLLERQMKLEKLKENSEELASGSENFASMAEQLKKQMENRKWWQL